MPDGFQEGREGFGFSGGDGEAEIWVVFLQGEIGVEEGTFFPGGGGAGAEELVLGEEADGVGEGVLAGEGLGEVGVVVFEGGEDLDFLRGSAEGEEAVGDGLGLDSEERELLEHGLHEGADEGGAGEGIFGEAAVDEGDGDAAGLGDGKEVGPGFQFNERDGIGLEAVEEMFDGEGKIEGEAGGVDARVVGVEGVGAGGAGISGGGERDMEIGVGGEEFIEEGLDREEFANADAVEEEEFGVFGAVGECIGAEAEAGGEVGAVFSGASGFEGEEGEGGGGGRGSRGCRREGASSIPKRTP